jgi:hypothetical protein
MEPENSLPYSQGPATLTEADEFNPDPHSILFFQHKILVRNDTSNILDPNINKLRMQILIIFLLYSTPNRLLLE